MHANWPIDTCGLPRRIVRAARAAGLRTAGDLMAYPEDRLAALSGLGRASLSRLREWQALTRQLTPGLSPFPNVEQTLRRFLDNDRMAVAIERWGLRAPLARGFRFRGATLKRIGDRTGRTRERIRQIEREALDALGSRPAMACLKPFCWHMEEAVDRSDRAMTEPAFRTLAARREIEPFNPFAVERLFERLLPDTTLRAGRFTVTTCPADETHQASARMERALREAQGPVPLENLASQTGLSLGLAEALAYEREDLGLLRDGRALEWATGLPALLTDVLRGAGRPLTHRTLTTIVNNLLLPHKTRGARGLLDALSRAPDIVRIRPGLYRCAS